MPNAEKSKWTPIDLISLKILNWIDEPPQNGSHFQIFTRNYETTFSQEKE